jgi:osomolarity two-component system, response regulator SKN7
LTFNHCWPSETNTLSAMNDVLAKPFTKEGMIRILKKHLTYMLKNPPLAGEEGTTPNGGPSLPAGSTPSYSGSAGMTLAPGSGHPSMTAGGPVKFGDTPIQSPATTSSWHSPTQNISHTSPGMDGGYLAPMSAGQGQMVITPGGTHRPPYPGTPTGPMPPGGMARMHDGMGRVDERPEKRQRMYGPTAGGY